MNSFIYKRAANQAEALREVAGNTGAKFLAGGTNLIDLMKMNVQQPGELVDINRLALKKIEKIPTGLRIGALVSNSEVANSKLVQGSFPVLSEALLSGASPQLRNMATVGGNLLQRTRCYYFMDTAFPCNKRVPGSGCPAIPGFNRIHAVLGASNKCIATHPSDMCVALAALDAVIRVESPRGAREIPITEFHRLPGDTPEVDTNLQPDELIVAVDLPSSAFAKRSGYLKVRDRAQYAFALVSVAAALDIKNGKIEAARLALGGVAHKPWRSLDAEKVLTGAQANAQTFKVAAAAAMMGAVPQKHNAFKIEMAKRAVARILNEVANRKAGGAA
ncbi:MAG: xanthine dehydrogenase family protein subunit M [Acidobacteria bacterium]|nr:xanthine dehydrogenase family protein subunit M [Acidobacteriota bacterium]MBA3806206.1 xanthine dehydrogenase family protein subunit M [Acidobacteriota bacterium]